MTARDEFEFLNSGVWLDYTQRRYLSVEEIRYRLQQRGKLPAGWDKLVGKVVGARKVGSIPLFMKSVDKKFWFFPSDSLSRKMDEIERLGLDLHHRINQQALFRTEFFLDSAIEEAITSAIYEGAHSTRAQAQQLIASGRKPSTKDEWMLVNNVRAMGWVRDHANEPISAASILELHRIVTQNTLEGDDANFSGKFRDDKIFVGPHEGVRHDLIAKAVPEAIALTTANPRYMHPLLRGILLHYLIAYVHPFFDGNGRTARALFYFESIRNGLGYVQLLSVSAYLKEHGKQYEKSFEKVAANELDVTYFVDFCLDSIQSAFKAVSSKVGHLLKANSLRERLGISGNQVGLIQRMLLNRFRAVSIEEYASQIGMSREIARQELKSLKDQDLLHEEKQGKKLVYRINKERVDALIEERR